MSPARWNIDGPKPFVPFAPPRFVPWAMLITAFVIDIFSRIGMPVGVLYMSTLIVAGTFASRIEVLGLGLTCMALILAAYGLAFAYGPHHPDFLHLSVFLASIALTCALMMRVAKSRADLLASNQALAESEWRYRSIFQQGRFPFWEQDFSRVFATFERLRREGVVDLGEYSRATPGFLKEMADSIITIEVNDAMLKLLGAKSRAEAPKSLTEIQAQNETMVPLLQSIFEGASKLNGRARIVTLDGKVKEVWVASELNLAHQRPDLVVGMLIDLTEDERAQRTLAAAKAELARVSRVATVGALSASIAHELNQPIGAIVMNAMTCLRYLKRTPPNIEEAIAAAERALREGRRASDIVNETRNMLTGGRTHEEVFDLVALIHEALALLSHQLMDANVETDLDFPADPIFILIDRVAMLQVFINLASNAIQAMANQTQKRRRLSFTLTADENQVVVYVRDTGIGIKEEDLGRIFEVFFTTRQTGTGVGLAISRSVIEARGGMLKAYNHPDGGAVFECRIPFSRE